MAQQKRRRGGGHSGRGAHDEHWRAILARNLKEARISKGVSMLRAAREVGVPYTRWLRWEHGKRCIDTSYIQTVVRYLGIPLVQLFEETPAREQSRAA